MSSFSAQHNNKLGKTDVLVVGVSNVRLHLLYYYKIIVVHILLLILSIKFES